MTAIGERRVYGLTVRWRTLEWLGAGFALFLLSGALFPALLMGPDGGLDDAARAKLRALTLPVYLIAGGLLVKHYRQFFNAMRRTIPLLILLALPVLSVSWSLSPSLSLRRAIGLLGSVLLAYLLAVRFTPRQMLVLVAFVLGPCMLLSLAAAAAMPSIAVTPMTFDVRGIYLHKNVLGWAAALSVIVTAFLVVDRSYGMRKTAIVFLGGSASCLILSQSATGLIVTISALVLAWFFTTYARLRGPSRIAFLLISLQVVAAVLISLDSFLVPLLEALGKDATLTGRVPLWALVDREIGHSLFWGYGYQAFWGPANPEAWRIWAKIGWAAPHAHNGYRDTLLSLGVIGLAALAMTVGRALAQGMSLQRRMPQDGWLWLNVFFSTFLVMNLTESMILIQNDLYWTLITAAIISFGLRHQDLSARHLRHP
jgi:exopolysaccharide production protein ExoQ